MKEHIIRLREFPPRKKILGEKGGLKNNMWRVLIWESGHEKGLRKN